MFQAMALVLDFSFLFVLNYGIRALGIGLVSGYLGHGGGALEGGGGGEVGEGRGRRGQGFVGGGGGGGGEGGGGGGGEGEVGVLDLAVGVVAEGGACVLQRHGVGGVGGGEGVPGADGVLHEALPVLASVHGFLVLDLGLCAAHFVWVGPTLWGLSWWWFWQSLVGCT